MSDSRLDADQIVSHCALRFDGYQYVEEHPFDPEQPVREFLETGNWNATELELLAAFSFCNVP